MYQFFVEPWQIQDKRIVITGSDVNHIKNVLRMKLPSATVWTEKNTGAALRNWAKKKLCAPFAL